MSAAAPYTGHPNADLIRRLYVCLQARDAAGMRDCYDPAAVFRDPVFGELRGGDVGAMWAMLCERARDLKVTASRVWADDARGGAHWEARYPFGPRRRPVHNVIEATFTFRARRIASHTDDFSLWRWSRQALGPVGWALGWTPLMARRARADAHRALAAFRAPAG